MSKPKRKKKVSDTTKQLLSLEHDRTVRAARARLEDQSAAEFWKQQRQTQGYAASQIFTNGAQTERDAAAESAIRNPVRDRIRVVDPAELERM